MDVLRLIARTTTSLPVPRRGDARTGPVTDRGAGPGEPAPGAVEHIEVVVESYHAVAVRQMQERYAERGFAVTLVPQPDNPYDPHSVAVVAESGRIGHLPPELARSWQPRLLAVAAEGGAATGTARVVGGTAGHPGLGVVASVVWAGQPWPAQGSSPA